MSEWQDAVTAPKDGTLIDVWTSYDERRADVKWSKDRQRWVEWAIGGFDTMDWHKVQGVVTHWMPRPDAPTPTSETDQLGGVAV